RRRCAEAGPRPQRELASGGGPRGPDLRLRLGPGRRGDQPVSGARRPPAPRRGEPVPPPWPGIIDRRRRALALPALTAPQGPPPRCAPPPPRPPPPRPP